MRNMGAKIWLGLVCLIMLVLWGDRGFSRNRGAVSRVHRSRTSPVVFPRPKYKLNFNHALHLKAGRMRCSSCHSAKSTSRKSGEVLLVGKKSCISCHPEAEVPPGFGAAGKRDTTTCLKCHTSFYPTGFPEKSLYPKPRITFSHELHRKQSVSCETCHAGVEKSTRLGEPHLPRMAQCRSCHTNRKVSVRCTTCHERRTSRLLRTDFPEGKLVPSNTLGLLNHSASFEKNHAAAARSHREECRMCHTDSTCLNCHGGVKRVMSIHPGNYRLNHAADARRQQTRCQSCHTRQRFCIGCHSRMGVSPTSNNPSYGPLGRKKFHPENWASTAARSPARNRHAVHARRSSGTCVGCHRESTCARCHSTTGVGGYGVNPHGRGFGRSPRCRTAVKRNKRVCLNCHSADSQRLLCR